MKIEQLRWNGLDSWDTKKSSLRPEDQAQIVVIFGCPNLIDNDAALISLRKRFPQAIQVGGSTSGNVLGATSSDSDLIATAIAFEHSRVRMVAAQTEGRTDFADIAKNCLNELYEDDLKHVLVLSEGLNVNGSELAKGLNDHPSISVTGGLMGDNGAFASTSVIANGRPKSDQICFVGFYGEKLSVRYGCHAGWEEFGINRVITRSKGNIVYEIDNHPALILYKKYLGDYAIDLPGSGLRFPLSIRSTTGKMIIRTLLGIDEKTQSLRFAGDVPKGATTLLMKGSMDNLIDGAAIAAKNAALQSESETLAMVISCVGRRMVLDQLVDEELDAVNEELGNNVWLTGFYSYGELAPHDDEQKTCSLHNQTMTLFTISEI